MNLHFEAARKIAQQEIQRRITSSALFSRYQFTPIALADENDYFWVFVSGSEQLFEDGVTPDAIYACVDKLDGHLWSREEQEQFYAREAIAEAASPVVAVF